MAKKSDDSPPSTIKALREWLAFQIENGHAPAGYPVELTPEYANGRKSAFEAVGQFLDQAE